MKKIFIAIMALLNLTVQVNAQQTQMDPPRLMVVPDRAYCAKHGYMLDDNTPDYMKALDSDQQLKNVLEQVRSLIQDRNQDFEIINLSQANENAKANEMLSDVNGASTAETIAEAIIRASEADVIVNVDFNVNINGPQKSMHITIDGADAFTGYSLSVVEGETTPSTSAAVSTLAREAVYNKMDGFMDKLLAAYQSWVQKGRPLNIEVHATTGSSVNLKSKVGDGMVFEHIEDFLYDNSKEQRGVTGSGSNTIYRYPSVYFPLHVKGRRGRTVKLSAGTIGTSLQNYLQGVGINCDYTTKGPGHLIIFVR